MQSLVDKSRKLFESGSLKSLDRRKLILEQIYTALIKHESDICDALWKDLHKHPKLVFLTELGILKNEVLFKT